MISGAKRWGRLATALTTTLASFNLALPATALDLFRYECTSDPQRPVLAGFVSQNRVLELTISEGPGAGSGTAGGFVQNVPEITQFSFEFLYTGDPDEYSYPHLLIETDHGLRTYGLPNIDDEGVRRTKLEDGFTRVETDRRLGLKNVANFGVFVSGHNDGIHSAIFRNVIINNESVGLNTSTFIPCGSIHVY